MLVAENDSLKIIASDMEIEAQETIATTVIEPGKTTVSASTFYDIVRKLPDGSTVELNLDGGHLEIKAARSRFRLPVLSPDDFPLIKAGELPIAFEMRSEEHTSELQSLMRISYAVFCLKKKTSEEIKQTNTQ